jgi:hypothetical protein
MTHRRHADALDRLDHQATSALDLFFGAAEPESALEPAAKPTPEPALESEDLTPEGPGGVRRRATRGRRTAAPVPVDALQTTGEAPARPDEGPGPATALDPRGVASAAVVRQAYIPVATGISALADEQLHQAAYAATGEREKSRLVRDAVGALIAAFDRSDLAGREALRELMRKPPVEGRITRIYRLEPEVRERLTVFARDERIPVAAVLRAAIEQRYGAEAPGSDVLEG